MHPPGSEAAAPSGAERDGRASLGAAETPEHPHHGELVAAGALDLALLGLPQDLLHQELHVVLRQAILEGEGQENPMP